MLLVLFCFLLFRLKAVSIPWCKESKKKQTLISLCLENLEMLTKYSVPDNPRQVSLTNKLRRLTMAQVLEDRPGC